MQLFYRDLGGNGLAPLIILHGMLGSSRNWQTAGADLAERFHVRALDLRNHGKSPHDAEMTYGAMVNDVLEWLNDNGIRKTTIMGHSMGGKVAMLLAARHPDRVDRLIVVDIAPKNYLSAAHRAEFAAMNELDLRSLRTRAEAELRFESRISDWAMRKFIATNLEQDSATGAWRWAINLGVLTAALPILEKNPLAESDQYAGPTLFLTGGRSRYVEPEDVPEIKRHFPAAELRVIPSSGHNPHMETRGEFVQGVLK